MLSSPWCLRSINSSRVCQTAGVKPGRLSSLQEKRGTPAGAGTSFCHIAPEPPRPGRQLSLPRAEERRGKRVPRGEAAGGSRARSSLAGRRAVAVACGPRKRRPGCRGGGGAGQRSPRIPSPSCAALNTEPGAAGSCGRGTAVAGRRCPGQGRVRTATRSRPTLTSP